MSATTTISFAVLLAAAASGCAGTPILYEQRLVDLTHPFTELTPSFPGSPPFVYERDARRREGGEWVAEGSFRGTEQSGTHLEAPMHFAEGRHGTDEIPLRRLVGPIRVVDVRTRCHQDPRHAVSLADLQDHERLHGRIPSGAAVLVRTGWDQFWSTPERYFGVEGELRFPGLSPEAARALVDKRVDLVGIDGPDLDPSDTAGSPAQRILAAANVPGLENLTGLGALPPLGATLIALPMRIDRGSGGPTRVVAIVP